MNALRRKLQAFAMAARRWTVSLHQRLRLLISQSACRPRGAPLQSRAVPWQRSVVHAGASSSQSDGEASWALLCAAAGAGAVAMATAKDARSSANCYFEPAPDGGVDRLKRWSQVYWNLPSGSSPSFHHTEVSSHLEKHLAQWSKGMFPDETKAGPLRKVLVPLCGKSVDMPYLCELGFGVVGVEGIPRAILEFKAEHQIRVKGMKSKLPFAKDEQGWREGTTFHPASQFAGARSGQSFKTGDQGLGYYSERPAVWRGKVNLGRRHVPLHLIEGDMLEVTPELVAASTFVTDGRFDLVYDCDALVSLPPDCWKQYAAGLSSLLRVGGRILLVVVQYDQDKLPYARNRINPPPFSVTREHIKGLFPDSRWSVSTLETEPCDEDFARYLENRLRSLTEEPTRRHLPAAHLSPLLAGRSAPKAGEVPKTQLDCKPKPVRTYGPPAAERRAVSEGRLVCFGSFLVPPQPTCIRSMSMSVHGGQVAGLGPSGTIVVGGDGTFRPLPAKRALTDGDDTSGAEKFRVTTVFAADGRYVHLRKPTEGPGGKNRKRAKHDLDVVQSGSTFPSESWLDSRLAKNARAQPLHWGEDFKEKPVILQGELSQLEDQGSVDADAGPGDQHESSHRGVLEARPSKAIVELRQPQQAASRPQARDGEAKDVSAASEAQTMQEFTQLDQACFADSGTSLEGLAGPRLPLVPSWEARKKVAEEARKKTARDLERRRRLEALAVATRRREERRRKLQIQARRLQVLRQKALEAEQEPEDAEDAEKMPHESPKAWQCVCGFSNRPTNSVCGGTGPLGCKAPRSPVGADVNVDDVEKDGDLPPRRPGTLRLATYNIHFGKNLQQARMHAIAQALMLTDPDIIALQEVTDALLPLLMRHLGADCWQVLPQMPSNPEDMFVFESNHFTALLVRKPLRVFGTGCVRFERTAMARLSTASQMLWYAQVMQDFAHESNDQWCPVPCARGLCNLTELMLEKGCEAAAWLGDMNWTAQQAEMSLEPGWIDLWAELQRGRVGSTYHANQGKYCALRARMDRVLATGVNVHDSYITRIGVEELKDIACYPSDHYGLFAALALAPADWCPRESDPPPQHMGSGLLALELFWLTVGPSSAVFILGRSVDDEDATPVHKHQDGERTIRFMPCDDSSVGSDAERSESSESSQDECDDLRDPIPVRLPAWYPYEAPLSCSSSCGFNDTGVRPLSHLLPAAPVARCTGLDKVSVTWQLENTRLLDYTWQVRVRSTAADSEWQKVDLDSGRVESSRLSAMSWKHRACIVQRGLKVLSFCVEEGRKSQRPVPGTVISHYPGLVTVDFELIDRVVVRQRVPQDWVLLAATSREIKDVAWSLVEHRRRFGQGAAGRRLWRVAKNKVYERIIRTHRQCAVLWSQQVRLPAPGSRVTLNCAMGVQVDADEKEDLSPDRSFASRGSRTAVPSISSWWPVVLPVEESKDLRSGTDRPEELCTRADLKVSLEPYPRIQVVPRHWICEDLPESERAKKNICPGQGVLSYYASSTGPDGEGEVWGAHPEPREAGDVTLQFGGAHLTEKPDDESFAQAYSFGSREVLHRSERAVRGQVLRELISPAEVYVYLQCMDRRKPVRIPLASIWSVQQAEPTRKVRKRRKVLEWLVLRHARDRPAEVVARQGSSAGLYNPVYGYLWDEAIQLTPGVKVSFFSLPGRGDATTASVASVASPAFRRLSTGIVLRTVAKVSHYEIMFEEVVPEERWISSFNVGMHLQSDGSVERRLVVRLVELLLSQIQGSGRRKYRFRIACRRSANKRLSWWSVVASMAVAWRGGFSRGKAVASPLSLSPAVARLPDLPRRQPLRRKCHSKMRWNPFWTASAAALLTRRQVRTKSSVTAFGTALTRMSGTIVARTSDDRSSSEGQYAWAEGVLDEVPLRPAYLVERLAPALPQAGDLAEASSYAARLLGELSLEVAHILTLPAVQRDARLDGLMDLSPIPADIARGREQRRRLHQALENMVRWFLHDPGSYLDVSGGASTDELRTFAAAAIVRKRALRKLSQSNVAFSTRPPSDVIPSSDEEPDVDAAAVHGLKQWSKAFKEWCFEAVERYFLLDPGVRAGWLTGGRSERSRVSILTGELRKAIAAKRLEGSFPLVQEEFVDLIRQLADRVLVHRPRVLDVGSCNNYFGRLHGEALEVTAVDMAPGHHSVLRCNFLELPISRDGFELEPLGPGFEAKSLPAGHFDVVIMALFFSILPSSEARGIAAAKARQLLKTTPGLGLLIIADTKGTVGRYADSEARTSAWVAAVEANGFQLARDPQLHLSKEHVKGRPGYWQRAFCWTFVTAPPAESYAPTAIPFLSDARPRRIPPERLQAQQRRQAKKRAREQKAQLKELAKKAKTSHNVLELETVSQRKIVAISLGCVEGSSPTFQSQHYSPMSVPRLRRPAVTIHDIPDELEEIEVSIGLSSTSGGDYVSWSGPSKPCRVLKVKKPLLPPLPPVLTVLSINRAQVRWVLPKDPAPICFRLRMREKGSQDWCFVDSFGHARDEDTTLAWRSRLVPLVEDLWVSAFGDFDNRKSSTPGAARVRKVDPSGSVEIDFVEPQEDFCIGRSCASMKQLGKLMPAAVLIKRVSVQCCVYWFFKLVERLDEMMRFPAPEGRLVCGRPSVLHGALAAAQMAAWPSTLAALAKLRRFKETRKHSADALQLSNLKYQQLTGASLAIPGNPAPELSGFFLVCGGPVCGDVFWDEYTDSDVDSEEDVLLPCGLGANEAVSMMHRELTPEDYEKLCKLDEAIPNRSTLQEGEVELLPRVRLRGQAGECGVCLSPLAGEAVQLPCSHLFHEPCIKKWLTILVAVWVADGKSYLKGTPLASRIEEKQARFERMGGRPSVALLQIDGDETVQARLLELFWQSDTRANRLDQMRRIAMDSLLGSTANDGQEEVEVQDEEDDDPADAADMDMDGGYARGKRMQRLRRLHRTLFFARQMQIPDWMLVPPGDLAERWLVLAKPEGDRCLLLSDGGRVQVRQKNGLILEKFTDSRFPRGLTILDAVCIEGPRSQKPVKNQMQDDSGLGQAMEQPSVEEPTSPIDDALQSEGDDTMDGGAQGGKSSGKARRRRPTGNRKYAICDVLVWGDMDMACTEAEFRLFWLQSRFEEMPEKPPRRARPLQLVHALPATPECIRDLYSKDFGYPKDSLMFLHREGRYQISEAVTPVAKLWRDRHLSRFVVDTPDEKGQDLPSKQSVVLEVRGGGRLRTADRHLVAQCREEDLEKLQGQAKNKSLVRCDIEAIDVVNRCLQVVPVAHVPARSRVWPDSWARIVFQHLHRSGQSSYISFEALMQAASGQWTEILTTKATVSKVQLTAHEIVGLRAEVGYEVSVQALTKGGWTDWSMPGSIQMPRIGYEQEQLVSERKANALYRADLLPQAAYKEYERCWDSVEECLTADRLERIQQVLNAKKDLAQEFDLELSRWLVDMEGPIRESSRMLEAEARVLLRDLVNRKANLNYRDQATGRVALTYACEYGWKVKPGIIEELLQLRADVDSMNDARNTALGIAASGGHETIVEVLLQHGADATVVSLQGETALLRARTFRGMTTAKIQGISRCRELLRQSRLPWESFEAAVANLADDPPAAARAFLELAFPGGPSTMFVADKEVKRISKHDKLRLYEQICEIRDVDDGGYEEAERRGRFCAQRLLLPQVRAASLQQPPNKECNYFARYLLHSGIMRWCLPEAKKLASELLAHYAKELQARRLALKKLPKLTQEAELFLGSRPKFAGRSLHQWHAHDDLPWLTQQNVVGTFEALVHSGAVVSMELANHCGADLNLLTIAEHLWLKRYAFLAPSHLICSQPCALPRGCELPSVFKQLHLTHCLAVALAIVGLRAAMRLGSTGDDTSFSLPQAQRAAAAGMVATLLASSPGPVLAEDAGLTSLEKEIAARDAGIVRLQAEKKKPKLKLNEVEKLEKEELQTARATEQLKEKRIIEEERKAKQQALEAEKREKAQIEKQEKEAKAKIDKEYEAEKQKIEREEKKAIEEARRIEKDEKKAARALEKQALSKAKAESDRLAAEEKSEAAFNAATEKAETAILAAEQKSEEALKAALEKAEKARVEVVEKSELLEKAAAERSEVAIDQATETAEKAEKDAVFEEEKVEQEVVEAVDAIEKEELIEENAILETLKDTLSSAWQVAAPIVIPGVFLAVYAVIASFFSKAPEPCLGTESEDVRKMMGRLERPKKAKATLDPWTDGGKMAVGASAAGAVLAMMSSSPTLGFVSASSVPSLRGSLAPQTTQSGLQAVQPRMKPAVQGYSALSSPGALVLGAALGVAGGMHQRLRKIRLQAQAKPSEISGANPLKVVVAGGGVGGLLLAKALSKEPTIKVTVLEQASAFQRFGGPIQLASNALSVIRDVDAELFEELMKRFTFTGYRKNGLVDALRTEWYCTFDAMKDSAEMYDLPYTGVVDRPDLQEIMLQALPEGVLVNATKVVGYEKLPNYEGVNIKTEDGTEYKADVLIGADGIWSATRAQMWNEDQKGPNSGCTYSGYIVFAGETIYKPDDYFDVGYKVYMGPKRYFVTSDVGRGRIQWYAFVAVGEGEEVPSDSLEKREYVKAAFQGWSSQIADLLDATPVNSLEDRSLYDRPPSVLKSWADGPVALLGDACHAMMPNLGQGGGQAMEDAHCIWQKLKDLTDRSQVPGALSDYYGARILRASAVQGLSRIASDILLGTFTFPWKASEGLSAPYGKGRGDFTYEGVVVNYLRHILPAAFTAQFTFLYSFHPFKWTTQEVKKLVGEVMDRHKVDANTAWTKRQEAVEKGEVEKFEEECKQESFFQQLGCVGSHKPCRCFRGMCLNQLHRSTAGCLE
ncbi:ABA2 [Symbiodinium sp. KB8]|nr:ABA2 [Symbiodinium sp. KB8]